MEVHPMEEANRKKTEGQWRILYLRLFYREPNYVQDFFPKTKKLIEEIKAPFVIISTLEAGALLSRHKGFFKGVLRYHLGLKCPTEGRSVLGYPPCYLQIDDYIHQWRDGEDFMFDDCCYSPSNVELS